MDREDRLNVMQRNDPRDRRSEGRRDRDRILYSSAFRRLAGITQVVPANDRHPIHNRLTHTLEVAQIGRGLAEDLLRDEGMAAAVQKLGGLDPDVVEAACLAHDLGHPPFGHAAEEALDEAITEANVPGGFEGNPQTFRILTRLGMRDPRFTGLNLTRATLCAVQKYPWLRGTSGHRLKKWGAYASEEMEFSWAREVMSNSGQAKSLESMLMDWSDDVAYGVHDVEDFFRAGLIPLDRLAVDSQEVDRVVTAEWERNEALHTYTKDELAEALDGILRFAPFLRPYEGSQSDRAQIRAFTSSLVSRYIVAVKIEPNEPKLEIARDAQMEVAMLKGLTWQYVIESRPLITQRYGHKRLIASLFSVLNEAGTNSNDHRIFPRFYQDALRQDQSDENIVRTVADLIASMTEAQVVAMHHRLTGISIGAALDPILP